MGSITCFLVSSLNVKSELQISRGYCGCLDFDVSFKTRNARPELKVLSDFDIRYSDFSFIIPCSLFGILLVLFEPSKHVILNL
jgi:hypothetical protein